MTASKLILLTIAAAIAGSLLSWRAPQAPVASASRWLILPGGAAGGTLDRSTSESSLIRQFGPANVIPHPFDLGEGETRPGTELFPHDPLRRIEILWSNPVERKAPEKFQISGDRSLWHTVHGITLGTTLKYLQALNGRPFRLAGLAFDYSGTVVTWSSGRLQSDFGMNRGTCWVWIRLDRAIPASQSGAYRSIMGDGVFSSSLPLMQRLNPAAYNIIWSIHQPPQAHSPQSSSPPSAAASSCKL